MGEQHRTHELGDISAFGFDYLIFVKDRFGSREQHRSHELDWRVKGLKDRDVPDSDVVLEILVAQGSLGKAF